MAEKAIAAVKPDADGNKAIRFTPENYEKIYLEWMNEHPRLVHLAPALVGPSHSRVALRACATRSRCRSPASTGDPAALRPLRHRDRSRRRPTFSTPGSPRACCRFPSSAGRTLTPQETPRRFRRLLSHLAPRHRLRHSLLLGRAHDHAGLLVLRSDVPDARWQPAPARRIRSVQRGLHSRPGARRQPRKDVQDQGQRHRSHRDREAVRNRCGALHAGLHGLARHRHRVQRGPHRRLPRLCQQDLERRALHLHECGPRRGGWHHGRSAPRSAPCPRSRKTRRSKRAGSLPNCTRPQPRSIESLENYRFDDAASIIYQFFWGSFCDWYLEIVKLRLDFEEPVDKQGARTEEPRSPRWFRSSRRLAAALALHAVPHRRALARGLRRQAAGEVDRADAVIRKTAVRKSDDRACGCSIAQMAACCKTSSPKSAHCARKSASKKRTVAHSRFALIEDCAASSSERKSRHHRAPCTRVSEVRFVEQI